MRKHKLEKQNYTFSGCVDFHTHILPQMDDGSRSPDESVAMLGSLYSQGVSLVSLTPHFYADGDTPERFFARREKSFSLLSEIIDSTPNVSLPQLVLGAEVEYFEGISCVDSLSDFSIGDSGHILIEMPISAWSGRIVDDILQVHDRKGCSVILAHVERYLFDQKKDIIHKLLENGVLMQSNASFFINKKTSRMALQMLKEGVIHLIGSDCHNMITRPPNMLDAMNIISKMLSKELVDDIMADAAHLLGRESFNG